ncbi:hypothetical protein SDJN02_02196, partial [Cucurbita argyrosperma subsp. argyrosperma]
MTRKLEGYVGISQTTLDMTLFTSTWRVSGRLKYSWVGLGVFGDGNRYFNGELKAKSTFGATFVQILMGLNKRRNHGERMWTLFISLNLE